VAWCRREGIRFTRGRPYRKQALAQQCQALDPIALARDVRLTLDLL